jgi:hypothetical protein
VRPSWGMDEERVRNAVASGVSSTVGMVGIPYELFLVRLR